MDEEIKGRLDLIDKKLDMLNEVTIRNGGGRHVTYKRPEFFQMIYDKHSIVKISESLYKYALVVVVIMQIIEFFIKK
jgi:hypothetical protein